MRNGRTSTPVLHHFNPLPPHGGRPVVHTGGFPQHGNFNPLPPHGGRLVQDGVSVSAADFNPLPPHGGRHPYHYQGCLLRQISIHSLRMEGDKGCRTARQHGRIFQSTPSAWRETSAYSPDRYSFPYFNPLPPHGGRPYGSRVIQCPLNFNPLPPHGGRRKTTCGMSTQAAFQSTPSAWRETALN